MEMSRFREPALFLLAGLTLLLVPAAIALVVLYDERQGQQGVPALPPLPSEAALLAHIHAFDTALVTPRLAQIYQARPMLRSGLLAVYGIYDQEQLVHRLALVRTDSTCSTCGDPGGRLLGVFLSPTEVRMQGLVSLAGEKVEKDAFDPALMLTQLQGILP
jgi:hypothetical protein